MQQAVDTAFPQALGMFEKIEREEELVTANVFAGNDILKSEWLKRVIPVLEGATLKLPVHSTNGSYVVSCTADEGGRKRNHTEHLRQLVMDMQSVYRSIPGAKW